MNNIENKLSDISAYPVVGTLAGVTKILLGTTQALTGLACGIMLLIPSAATRDWSSMKSSWTHIKHGVGNMTAGVFESIPFVQTAIYGIRRMKQGRSLTYMRIYIRDMSLNLCRINLLWRETGKLEEPMMRLLKKQKIFLIKKLLIIQTHKTFLKKLNIDLPHKLLKKKIL
ncbi:MAG: hypothetical protein HWD61_00905 [Parachlamydiaceae bacterium]|nr:MAG: hypothetical protein HWD61_00905 [Parachlamydiaceae bacterium]